MKKPCSTCDSIIVVSAKSLPNPQCHTCRLGVRTTKCEHCGAVIVRENRSKKRRFCSPQCFGASGEGNRSRLKYTSQVMNCAWCDHPFNYTADHQRDGTTACSTRCGGYLRMKPSRPWKPPRVVVPKVEKVIEVNRCRDCGLEIAKRQQRCADCKEKALVVSKRKKRAYETLRRKITGDSSNHRKRARKYGCFYESVNRIHVFERDGYICHLCGTKTDPSSPTNSTHYPSLDHIIPMSKQGPHSYSNIATACFMCNALKRDLDLDDALLMLR